MSRLIFEGNTRERFGELFPKPFIEEIRVFDNVIQTDVALYFEIEEGKDAATFLQETGLSDLKVHLDLESGVKFETYIGTDRPLNTLLRKYITTLGGGGRFSTLNGEPPKLSDSGFAEHEFFYNTEGKKFIKFYMTISRDVPSGEVINRKGVYLYCLTFFAFNDAIFDNLELYSKQYSDLSFEKLYNEDGSLNTSRQQVYLEPDGNYYSKTPLMSLDRRHRKTNSISHQQVSSNIQQIIQPYVGSIEEADLISRTLQEYSNSPRLLLRLKNNINNFSNKSSATTIGTLYGDLVDAITDINAVLIGSEELNNRLQFNKIKDRRGEKALLLTERTATNTQSLQEDFGQRNRFFFSTPLIYKNIDTNVPPRDFAFEEEAYITTKGYLFFDYEKALNYRSSISEVFNPYNILELFGKNSLNKHFQVKEATCKLRSDTCDLDLIFRDNSIIRGDVEPFAVDTYESDINHQRGSLIYPAAYSYLYNGNESYTFIREFKERAFDTGISLDGYRLKCYEADYIKPYIYVNEDERISLEIDIVDSTLRFYQRNIKVPMFKLIGELRQYREFAEEFCSYNNIDERFNDFFQESVAAQFEQPYPWEQGPLLYHSLRSLMLGSWNFSEGTATDRRLDGVSLDLESIKEEALREISNISPSTGKLDSVSRFVDKFESFYIQYFAPTTGFIERKLQSSDSDSSDIPSTAGGRDTIPNVREFTMQSNTYNTRQIPVDMDLNVLNPDASEVEFYDPSYVDKFIVTNPITYEQFEDRLENFMTNSDYQVSVTVKQQKLYDNGEADGPLNTIREERVKSFNQFMSDNINGGDPNTRSVQDANYDSYIKPIFDDFHQTFYNLLNESLLNYDDSNEPLSNYQQFQSKIESNLEEIIVAMCNDRFVWKLHNEGNYINYIYFSVERESVEKYLAFLMINYYQYSFYVDRRGISLKDFMNLHLDQSLKIS